MKKLLTILAIVYSVNSFAGAGATFTIKNLSPHPISFKLQNPKCMNNIDTAKTFTAKPDSVVSIGYIEAKASSSGGDFCATANSTFELVANDPAAVDDALPTTSIQLWHTVDVKWDFWNSEEYNNGEFKSGSERFIFSNGGRWTRWDGAGNVEIDYYPCEKRIDCSVEPIN